MPARSEDWVIGLSARVALKWCDAIVILNHASMDNTADIIDGIVFDYPGRVTVLEELNPKWDEMAHRQRMLDAARAEGATHIAIVDADEILTGNILNRIQLGIKMLAPGQVMQLPLYNLRHGIDQYHSNGVWGNRFASVCFMDRPDLHWSGDKLHHREPMAAGPLRLTKMQSHGDSGVMHLWGASERRLLAKHRKYKMIERVRWPHKRIAEIERMYNMAVYGQPADPPWKFAPVPQAWWDPYRDLMPWLTLAAEPHQERECEALLAEHGADYFSGLDLFYANYTVQ